jgi:hypothetical protein
LYFFKHKLLATDAIERKGGSPLGVCHGSDLGE